MKLFISLALGLIISGGLYAQIYQDIIDKDVIRKERIHKIHKYRAYMDRDSLIKGPLKETHQYSKDGDLIKILGFDGLSNCTIADSSLLSITAITRSKTTDGRCERTVLLRLKNQSRFVSERCFNKHGDLTYSRDSALFIEPSNTDSSSVKDDKTYYVNHYDTRGFLIKKIAKNNQVDTSYKSTEAIIKTKYDSLGRVLTKSSFNGNGTLYALVETEYFGDSIKSELNKAPQYPERSYGSIYRYKAGLLLTKTSSYANGTIEKTEYKYHSNRIIKSITSFNSEIVSKENMNYKKEFDKSGKILFEKGYSNIYEYEFYQK